MNKIIVDIGCGSRKLEGAIGIDRFYQPGVDVVCNFEHYLPLKTNSVDVLHASHVLEHIQNLIQLMEEIYRVCKSGAQVDFTVPYFTSRGAFRDPTHVRYLSEETFLYFQHPAPYGIKTDFQIQAIHYKYRTLFRFFPECVRKIFRRHLWNVVDEFKVSLKVQKIAAEETLPSAGGSLPSVNG